MHMIRCKKSTFPSALKQDTYRIYRQNNGKWNERVTASISPVLSDTITQSARVASNQRSANRTARITEHVPNCMLHLDP